MKFKVWLDSGANIHSKYSTTVDLEDIGIDKQTFDEMTEEEKEDMFKDIAFERADWGWAEI